MEKENTVRTQQQDNTITAEAEKGTQQQEKTFTQEDVNRIIGERLARVRAEISPELQEREKACAQRELQLDARERLAEAGLPKELLGVINCSTKEELDNSIRTIQELFGQNKGAQQYQPNASTSRGFRVVSTGLPNGGSGGGYKGIDDPASIRKAMGLKG